MNLPPEQIAAAQKANLETLSGLIKQALQSIEKLVNSICILLNKV
uniref:Uncharacterized protein n=1 Tax=Polynucleobacter necessarius subsp. necessarius (strain STIR1) TaxID=452638 RepID=B1XV81_POLNS